MDSKVVLPKELNERIQAREPIVILDVREPWEYETGHIYNSINVPIGNIDSTITEKLARDGNIIVITVCEHGVRSEAARQFLAKLGYNVRSLDGGMEAWRASKMEV